MMPSGHKAFLVHNPKDVELLLMHNRTYAAEYVEFLPPQPNSMAPFVPWAAPCGLSIPSSAKPSSTSQINTRPHELTTTPQDRTRRLIKKTSRHPRQGQGSGRQSHQREGQGHRGVIDMTKSWLSETRRSRSGWDAGTCFHGLVRVLVWQASAG
jgi:hypothetical protein